MSQRNGSRSFWTLANQIEKNISQIPSIQRVPHTMREATYKHKTVRHVLLFPDIIKASGPDLIPVVLLKRCAAELAPIPYESGTFPENRKFLHTDPYNYRPIALLSCIHRELLDYLEPHGLISDKQYGKLLAYVIQLGSKLIQSHGEAHSDKPISAVAIAGKKLGYLFRAEIRPSLEAVRLIDDFSLTDRRAVNDLAFFYHYTSGLRSSELSSMMPPHVLPDTSA
ncbi:unnamed protein product [Acanthoscelides obtectus]|uniref:Uncharacterized protein n=1 Tax=Acanthoscelides obtectus TaxID=200917 RepID=A0A9P0MLF1_ACAOB|nr:unnamed protein product [Acanthoscelides obtectus]CAK1640179.1 hypothetical protein AOBTE_LOCUS11580 [Acanthoscelides obtectus]